MRRYQIEQTQTGVVLWTGDAASEQDALERLALDVGYDSRAEMDEVASGGETLRVTDVGEASVLADLFPDTAADVRRSRNFREAIRRGDMQAAINVLDT